MSVDKRLALIEYLSKNRVSTTEFADAMGKVGFIYGPKPLQQGLHIVGNIRHVQCEELNNSNVHSMILNLEKGDILFVEVISPSTEVAIMGELMVKSAILYQQAAAVVVKGAIRDAARINRERFPVWAADISPIGARNLPEVNLKFGPLDGGIAVCDDGGVVAVREKYVSDELLTRIHLIELQEDIWRYCLDTLKWSTFDTVVQKKYFEHAHMLPEHMLASLDSLESGFSPLWFD
jgi:regulator of RNase E activity RraA